MGFFYEPSADSSVLISRNDSEGSEGDRISLADHDF